MFRKLSCIRCKDPLGLCCTIPSGDESENGVKILRKKDIVNLDLQSDLSSLTRISVVQRLKLIVEKLRTEEVKDIGAEIVYKNIQYAIDLIENGESDQAERKNTLQYDDCHEEEVDKGSKNITRKPGDDTTRSILSCERRDSCSDVVIEAPSVTSFESVLGDQPPGKVEETIEQWKECDKHDNLARIPSILVDEVFTTDVADVESPSGFPDSSSKDDADSKTVSMTETELQQHLNRVLNEDSQLEDENVQKSDISDTSKRIIDSDTQNIARFEKDPNPPEISKPATKNKTKEDEPGHELSEVDEEVIPEEVRKWLAATFTKTKTPPRRTEPRPRFRSVANAIRVGLFVDRFYRQLSATTLQIPSDIAQQLKEINNWHFDIFKLQETSNNHSVKYVAKELLSRYGLVQRFRINLDKLDSFLSAVEYGYTKLKNPYHNDVHAADVTQTTHFLIASSGVANILTDLEIFSILFAALIHDIEHTGRTNNFHINVGTELALLYNDRSVLENHHVSAAFKLLKDEDKNMLSFLKPEEYREFRALVIEMVLSTDMSTHFAQIKHARTVLHGERNAQTTQTLMSLLLHCADISHPGKPWKLHKKFADAILEEFFLQGDEESKLGLPFSPLCDRTNTLVPESQISFIEFIVEPSLSILSDLIDFVVKADSEKPLILDSSGENKNSKAVSSVKETPSARRNIFKSSDSSDTSEFKEKNGASSSNSGDVGTRRAESDGSLQKNLNEQNIAQGMKNVLTSRTPSFPLQSSQKLGTTLRPWLNHLVENKAKWRMISAESAEKTNPSQTSSGSEETRANSSVTTGSKESSKIMSSSVTSSTTESSSTPATSSVNKVSPKQD